MKKKKLSVVFHLWGKLSFIDFVEKFLTFLLFTFFQSTPEGITIKGQKGIDIAYAVEGRSCTLAKSAKPTPQPTRADDKILEPKLIINYNYKNNID